MGAAGKNPLHNLCRKDCLSGIVHGIGVKFSGPHGVYACKKHRKYLKKTFPMFLFFCSNFNGNTIGVFIFNLWLPLDALAQAGQKPEGQVIFAVFWIERFPAVTQDHTCLG